MNRKRLIPAIIAVFLINIIIISLFSSASAASYRRGSTGSTVSEIQTRLKNWGYYSGKVDGIFGSATEAAVKKFQAKNGLTADGIVGPATLSALGISGGGSGKSENDVALLGRALLRSGRRRRRSAEQDKAPLVSLDPRRSDISEGRLLLP